MVSRLNKKEIDIFYPILTQRDNEFCFSCGKSPQELGVDKLEIHETRYERPLKSFNMKLYCHGCNHTIPKEIVETMVRDATPEHRVKLLKEFQFRKWALHECRENNNHYSYEELIDSGAYLFDLSTETVKRYMRPLMSKMGVFSKPMMWENDLHVFIKGHEPFSEENRQNLVRG